ncbi:Endonuclease/exonuclease/phosphatase [Senna tora]|uniref:Endonuclease/exonuclease/phosphatase n=1 Tax=Senna tora TaxID=362788 RepID=A0A834W5X7_9FABA|nr:Endonuclease/exonuclease/phosphatase [Senna tora]
MRQILNEGPWSVQGGLLIVFPWERNIVVRQILVNEVSVWVQLWDVPLEYQTPLVAHRIGYLLGVDHEVDWTPTFPRNLRFLRCRFERIFHLCCACGRVGHITKECDWSDEQTNSALDDQHQWIQHRFGNEYGLMVDRAYFVP